ncbi:MAG TPA: hypothetical protein VFO10_11230 [Oligoflexus sp.]|uniref:hypothetical protein n=1 Tax=Oligoflexus sp. TaxID=1971216 RepID=UPI002D807F14|nr:hypothetical protein [Oligoflexus sp.]HET9237817.1 hypothetical protein [Oligoflexus sp.]
MPIKIGFINFTALDAPAPTEYAAYKKLARILEPHGHVKSLAESHPPMPPIRFEPPALNRTPDTRLYKLAAELAPWMDEFHHRVLDRARIHERLKMIERTRFQNDLAEIKYYRQVDRLHAWITELLFERIYQRVGRNLQMFDKVAQREWQDLKHWHEVHKEQRLKEAKAYPELHKKELVHPYRFEIKLPNDKKAVELGEEHILKERHIVQEARLHAHQLRLVLHDIIFDEVKQELKRQYMNRRDHYEQQGRWHMHDVLRAFDKAWMHAWDSRDTFRELVRRGIFKQAELYPKLFKQSLVDLWETEIREPNEKNHHQKFQVHLDAERRQQKLVQLETEAGRKLLKTNKVELENYRQVSSEHIEVVQDDSQWQKHVLVERRDQKNLESREHVNDAKRVESQGYQLLAGRMVPQPRFGIDADIVTQVPLALGVNGDPRAPEHVVPTPIRMIPAEQKKNWQKIHAEAEEELRGVLSSDISGWHEKTQGIRQNLAALDYAEQSTREVQRPEPQTLGDIPGREDTVKASARLESVAESRTALSTDAQADLPSPGPKKDQKAS